MNRKQIKILLSVLIIIWIGCVVALFKMMNIKNNNASISTEATPEPTSDGTNPYNPGQTYVPSYELEKYDSTISNDYDDTIGNGEDDDTVVLENTYKLYTTFPEEGAHLLQKSINDYLKGNGFETVRKVSILDSTIEFNKSDYYYSFLFVIDSTDNMFRFVFDTMKESITITPDKLKMPNTLSNELQEKIVASQEQYSEHFKGSIVTDEMKLDVMNELVEAFYFDISKERYSAAYSNYFAETNMKAVVKDYSLDMFRIDTGIIRNNIGLNEKKEIVAKIETVYEVDDFYLAKVLCNTVDVSSSAVEKNAEGTYTWITIFLDENGEYRLLLDDYNLREIWSQKY